MPHMEYTIVDVFAEAAYQGNPLAVVRGGARLDAATMQAIARLCGSSRPRSPV
jgi:predicted PhzF superfamily epimerase YddE/YHI9